MPMIETADHSMGYMTVAALIDGDVTRATFEPRRFKGKKYLNLLDRTTIREAADLNRGYPDGIPNRLKLRMKSGKVYKMTVKYPRGHAGNPMSDQEVEAKFRSLAEGVVSKALQDRLLTSRWTLNKTRRVDDVWRFDVMPRPNRRG